MNLISVYYFFYIFKNQGLAIGLSSEHVFFRFIEKQESTMYFSMGIFLVISLIVLAVGGFILSHKIAGPLFRLTSNLKQSNEKSSKPNPIKFRNGDYFPEIEEEFNKMVKNLRN